MLLVAEAHRGCIANIAGYAAMRIHHWNRSGHLPEFASSKEWKRNSVGKAMLDEIKKFCKRNGLRTVIIETQPGNREANEFYEAMGQGICGYNDRHHTNAPESAKDTALFYSMNIS